MTAEAAMIMKRPGAYVRERPRPHPIERVDTSTTAFVGPTDAGPVGSPVRIRSWTEFTAQFGARTGGTGHAVADFFRNGGTSAVVVRTAGSTLEDYVGASGLPALEAAEFALLCLTADQLQDDVPATAWSAAAALCVRHRAFLIINGPAALPADQLPGWVGGLGLDERQRRTAAVYAPRLQELDDAGASVLVAPAGAVAGMMARGDATYGVWKTPAGGHAELEGVRALAEDLSDSAIGELAAGGVNAIRSRPGVGAVVWGSRTVAGGSTDTPEWRYVSLRRYLAFLEHSIDAGLAWAVFEPNGEQLWTDVRRQVTTFLLSLRADGALVGRRPQDAFVVRCGRDTMTQADVDAGILVVQVGVAPLRPAEFVEIDIRTLVGRRPLRGRSRISDTVRHRWADLLRGGDETGPPPTVHRTRVDAEPTLAALAAAGTPVRVVDLSRVHGHWAGETEQHLTDLFDEAERAGAVLLFDEADALFGRRSDVRDAHDRFTDQEVDEVLRRIEQHRGSVIIIGGGDVVEDTSPDPDPD